MALEMKKKLVEKPGCQDEYRRAGLGAGSAALPARFSFWVFHISGKHDIIKEPWGSNIFILIITYLIKVIWLICYLV